MLPFPPAFTHADPAFAPRTRVRLAAAPATAWAAGLSVPTCLALLWALHEGFIAGEIMLRPGKAAADMPPLFIITGEGAEITNYRVQGRRMIVDRIFDRAELRLGVRAPVIVRIDREGARR